MQRIIGVTELQRRFRAVFDEVAHKRVPYVLTRGSHPEVVMIPYEDFLRLQELQEKEVLVRFDRLLTRMAEKNVAYSEEEIAADIERARRGRAN
jgi:prevent-host-death family protein